MVKLFGLAALIMVAFAANSVLNRAALSDGDTGPAAFAAIRLVSGALCLFGLAAMRGGRPRFAVAHRWIGTSALLAYVLGFSFAYVALDAGAGALILFGGVQITMFAGALAMGERPPAAKWIGSVVAFGGLAWLLWPGSAAAPDFAASALMAVAALGWGVYSLAGRGATDPLGDTAANFVLAAPVALVLWAIWPDGLSTKGALLACISGAITSGVGYALWYALLPRIDASTAALAQLTVPVIAAVGGAVLLAEWPTLQLVLAGAIVLGGVAFGILGAQRATGSSGS